MPVEPRAHEIARIEHELEILRSSYATMGYWGSVMRKFFMIALPIGAILILALVYRFYVQTDLIYFAFFIGLVAVVGGLLWAAGYRNQPKKPFRWIDWAVPLGPIERLKPNSRTEAEIIEEQIADREKRLAQLRSGST